MTSSENGAREGCGTTRRMTRPPFVQRGSIVAIIAATLPGAVQGLAVLEGVPSQLALAGLTALALLLGIGGAGWAERKEGLRHLSAVLLAYFVVVVAALWLTSGRAFLIAMPMVSLLVLYLPLRVALGAVLALISLLTVMLPVEPHQLLLGFGSAFVFVIVFSRIARSERYARAEIERLSSELEVLAATRERNRIAREIHDSLGHYLTVANVQLEAARAMEAGRDERLARVQDLLKEGLGQLRESVSMLRETMPAERPFTTALMELVSTSHSSGLAVELRVTGAPRPLPGAVGFTLYRATQEALTNAQRHASARRVDVALDYAPGQVRLEVCDDGRGAPGGVINPGNGLQGLRERVELIGGALELGHGATGGLTLAIRVPA